MAKNLTWTKSKNRYTGQVDGGPPFLIGYAVPYHGRLGLTNEETTAGQIYDPAQYLQFGFWAKFIGPTAVCESRNSFHCLNTYDAAAFTYGFLQFGAHVANGDFVQWFRHVLALPAAADWFPDLIVQNGRIAKETTQGVISLEDDHSTVKLMHFLNAQPDVIDTDEIINSAKLIAWQAADPLVNELQVETGVSVFKSNMKLYAKKYGLNGAVDTICAVIADVRHQGRASSSEIMEALHSHHQLDALLSLGQGVYPERCKTLQNEIMKGQADGVFGTKHYHMSSGDFA